MQQRQWQLHSLILSSGRYYDGPGNHFWTALHLSGFLPRPMGPQDDSKLLDLGIGFTNVVPRTTRVRKDSNQQGNSRVWLDTVGRKTSLSVDLAAATGVFFL